MLRNEIFRPAQPVRPCHRDYFGDVGYCQLLALRNRKFRAERVSLYGDRTHPVVVLDDQFVARLDCGVACRLETSQKNEGQEAVIRMPPGPSSSDRSSNISAEGGAGAGTSVGRIAYLNVQSKYACVSPESSSLRLPGTSIILHIADQTWLLPRNNLGRTAPTDFAYRYPAKARPGIR